MRLHESLNESLHGPLHKAGLEALTRKHPSIRVGSFLSPTENERLIENSAIFGGLALGLMAGAFVSPAWGALGGVASWGVSAPLLKRSLFVEGKETEASIAVAMLTAGASATLVSVLRLLFGGSSGARGRGSK